MCGFAGVLSSRGYTAADLERSAHAMALPIAHRGPDDEGVWIDPAAGLALGFRRLAIIDLSVHGHQPMRSPTGRYTLVFNGEVYNHGELRAELLRSGFSFCGHSDTETILAAFEQWGIEAAVKRFVGMFAIAVWDARDRALSFVRDRLGIKPLFLFWRRGHLLFGSELKALMAGPEFDRTLNTAALGAYLRYLYVPAPDSIFQYVRKLLPGHILSVMDVREPPPESHSYWSVTEVAQRGLATPVHGSDEDLVGELERLLGEAVRMRLRADVPVGALLSGGIDSSAVVALAQAGSSRPLKTYSIGFDVADFDEVPFAAAVARHIGTDHTELRLTGADALALVPRLPELFDEPFADPSQMPTYLICQLARREVTVALSGDGGDEMLAGYHRYIEGERVIGRLQRVPRAMRRAVHAGVGDVSSAGWDRLFGAVSPILPPSRRHRLPGEKLSKVCSLLARDSAAEMYRCLISAWQHPERILLARDGRGSRVETMLERQSSSPLLNMMLATDQATYLADDLLAKVDRASMAVSLEVRVPLLDHRLVEYSWRLPRELKIRGHAGKWALRQILYRHVPRGLVDRPKMGFTVPTAQWLRGALRSWAEDLLFAHPAYDEVFDRRNLRRAWQRFVDGDASMATGFWAVLMLQGWRERWAS